MIGQQKTAWKTTHCAGIYASLVYIYTVYYPSKHNLLNWYKKPSPNCHTKLFISEFKRVWRTLGVKNTMLQNAKKSLPELKSKSKLQFYWDVNQSGAVLQLLLMWTTCSSNSI